METFPTLGFSALLLAAVAAFWIDEYRFALFALGAATVVALLGDDVWVHGGVGAILGSPLLLVLIPLAKRSKRRRFTRIQQNAVDTVKTAMREKERVVKSTEESSPKTDLQNEHKTRVQAMVDRLKADPVSAVLRRQVPVRFDETARSWLGGLPQMPNDIPWPRGGEKNWPMHFAAQICCADLPDHLWQGKGPRDGWLLLFIDGYRIGGGGDEEAASAVIHINQLGPERQPPNDLHGVQDLYMSGASYPQAFDQSYVPSVWRRWPLDIVEQEQRIELDRVIAFTKKPFSPTPTTEEELYGIAPQSRRPELNPDICPPRTWQGALDFVNAVTNRQRKRVKQPARDLTAKMREDDGWLERLIRETEEALEARIAKRDEFASELHELERSDLQSADDERRRKFLEEKGPIFANLIAKEQDTLARLLSYFSASRESDLEAEISAAVSGQQEWWKLQGERLDGIRADIETKDLSAPISEDEWSVLQDELGSVHWPVFRSESRGSQAPAAFRWGGVNLSEHVWGGDLLTNHYFDLYTQGPETRDLIPSEALETVEQLARSVRWDRPHRMGGIADPLQSDICPDDAPLLFQIASDDGMNWMWGDAGALFVGTNDAELAARRFHAFANLECH